MNVEAQRISPGADPPPPGQGEPGQGVPHLHRRHGRLVDEEPQPDPAGRKTWSSSRAPAAAGTRSAMTAARRIGAGCSPGRRRTESSSPGSSTQNGPTIPISRPTVEVRFTARRRPRGRVRASRPRAVRREGRGGARRLRHRHGRRLAHACSTCTGRPPRRIRQSPGAPARPRRRLRAGRGTGRHSRSAPSPATCASAPWRGRRCGIGRPRGRTSSARAWG